MENISIKQNRQTRLKFGSYPKEVYPKMNALRDLILETASEIDNIQKIVETLKWNEPSYLVKNGSTIRMDWKTKTPDQYALYFNCNTSLVETFKAVYGNTFQYEKNRAIVFDIDDEIPRKELKECIKMAMKYHLLKDLPFLGK